MLNEYTYGKSDCAQNLVNIVNKLNDKKVRRSVSRFLADNNKVINQLALIKDNDVQKNLVNIYRQSLINTTINVPEKVKTHAVNILIGKIRDDIFKYKK